MNLCEKHRPKHLRELRGQDAARAALESFVRSPYPAAFLLSGDTGVGKTTAALALANDLGCRADAAELGGVNEIASGEQTADSVRAMVQRMAYRPFYGSGWKVLIVNECDHMSPQAQAVWLDALEQIPAYTVIVFTTNAPDKLPARFRDRCEHLEFASDAATLRQPARELVAAVWQAETGQLAPPQLSLDRVIVDGRISFRRILQLLAPMVRQVA